MTAKPAVVNNFGQIVMDSQEEVVKKKNKRADKKKEQLAKFYVLGRLALFSRLGSSVILVSCHIPVPISRFGSSAVLLSDYMPAVVSCPGSPAVLSSYCVPTPVSCSKSPAVLLFHCLPSLISCPGSLAIVSSCCVLDPAVFAAFFLLFYTLLSCYKIATLLLLLFVLGLPFSIGFLPFRIFKQSLLDEPWPCRSTSLAKPFRPFPALDVYNPDDNNGLHNLTNTNKFKRGFNTTLINSCSLAVNHD